MMAGGILLAVMVGVISYVTILYLLQKKLFQHSQQK
jgi:hypothetical protein